MKFNSKINIPSVNQSNGSVNFTANGHLASWNGANHGIKDVLVALKQEMIANKRANQPAEGDMF